tara:strand:- start:697 stop:825 length:129 start_codon:yes stop_codon:yes gene_type:complete
MAYDKLDLVFKKVFAGKAITDEEKAFFNESFRGRALVFGSQI